MIRISRRDFAVLAGGAILAPRALAQDSATPLITRAIPSTGEHLPVVGLGTARVFDSDDAETRAAAARVVQTLIGAGGRIIDTASSYGDAETVLGAELVKPAVRDKIFIATKVEGLDRDELLRCLTRLKVKQIDLVQLHNVRDPDQSLAKLKEWKAQGLCRYIGITSTYHGDFAAIEAVLRREKPDFIEIDYAIDDRLAEKRILPLAAEVKAAVLTAVPFGRGRLFRSVRAQPVPDWVHGFAGDWAQFFLKFLLADPRVTAVIPGTADARHMAEDLGAMRGALPDPDQRRRMAAFVNSL